ncbi:hypothetical protein HETIRDRAFT_109131 [Heterobasidion irregulare TC 32-1]|uniref:Uncharacterized protein n=1 Tax=Heterobasidion irregulare (strain TC 32-1) TaxID=747525 RepID=W4KCI0_HETIT|nr:uncharacterized protein HETIRDRAFT_109131 [Heterobasidion irregulare TC 32-1]ETW83444.1 hypothetical protein HETIRDRAFT_109131 [Heterobasidion irregulare TC 32-1]
MSNYPPNWPHSGYGVPNNARSDPNGPPDPYRFNTTGTRQQGQSYDLIPSGQQQYYSVDQSPAYLPNQAYNQQPPSSTTSWPQAHGYQQYNETQSSIPVTPMLNSDQSSDYRRPSVSHSDAYDYQRAQSFTGEYSGHNQSNVSAPRIYTAPYPNQLRYKAYTLVRKTLEALSAIAIFKAIRLDISSNIQVKDFLNLISALPAYSNSSTQGTRYYDNSQWNYGRPKPPVSGPKPPVTTSKPSSPEVSFTAPMIPNIGPGVTGAHYYDNTLQMHHGLPTSSATSLKPSVTSLKAPIITPALPTTNPVRPDGGGSPKCRKPDCSSLAAFDFATGEQVKT